MSALIRKDYGTGDKSKNVSTVKLTYKYVATFESIIADFPEKRDSLPEKKRRKLVTNENRDIYIYI